MAKKKKNEPVTPKIEDEEFNPMLDTAQRLMALANFLRDKKGSVVVEIGKVSHVYTPERVETLAMDIGMVCMGKLVSEDSTAPIE